MITKLKFNDDYFCFFKDEELDLKPITLLVGDQGCGKSTLLGAIKDSVTKQGSHSQFKTKYKEPTQNGCYHLDMEKNNPAIEKANPNDSNDMLYKLMSRWESHGETLFPILRCLSEVSDCVILIDEPETALSLRSQYKLIEILNGCVERNCQVIIATHNVVFMEAFKDNLLSLEHMRYVSLNEFVELQKGPNKSKEARQDKKIKKENCRMGLACECTKDSPFYDRKCIHYVDRDGASGYDRQGSGINFKMKKGDFKNG